MNAQSNATLLPEEITGQATQKAPYSEAVAGAVRQGLSGPSKWLPAWLFYDAEGSRLFEQITSLPEYYLTRTERAIFSKHAHDIVQAAMNMASGKLRMLELGAGSASKTGILLAAAIQQQGATDYLPVDVSESAMDEARESLSHALSGVRFYPQIANYVIDPLLLPPHSGPTLALYIGSSIGNFSPDEAVAILRNLRAQLRPGDSLLLGTDMVKPLPALLAAYNDSRGITAAFNLNMLRHINRSLDAEFDPSCFSHSAVWNAEQSRIEMHLRSKAAQTVRIPGANMQVSFKADETIHTENSYKFTEESVIKLLDSAGFAPRHTWHDEQGWFAVTLAAAIA